MALSQLLHVEVSVHGPVLGVLAARHHLQVVLHQILVPPHGKQLVSLIGSVWALVGLWLLFVGGRSWAMDKEFADAATAANRALTLSITL